MEATHVECLYLNTIEQLFQLVKDFAFRPQFLQFLSSLRLLKLLGIQIKTSSLNFNILLMHNFASIKKKNDIEVLPIHAFVTANIIKQKSTSANNNFWLIISIKIVLSRHQKDQDIEANKSIQQKTNGFLARTSLKCVWMNFSS